MESKEHKKERLLKLLEEIKEDTYNYVDMNDSDFIKEYNIREIEKEYENSINEFKKADKLLYFWFKQAFSKLYSIRLRWWSNEKYKAIEQKLREVKGKK